MNASKIVLIAILILIGSTIAFLFVTRALTTTTNSLSCEGARSYSWVIVHADTNATTGRITEITSSYIYPSTTFTTATNVSASKGRVVISTTELEMGTSTAVSGPFHDFIVNMCIYVK